MTDLEARSLMDLYCMSDVEITSKLDCFFIAMDFDSQAFDLRMWRGSIPKRKWRRWRGRVAAGKPIPRWAIMFDQPRGTGLPTPFVRPL